MYNLGCLNIIVHSFALRTVTRRLLGKVFLTLWSAFHFDMVNFSVFFGIDNGVMILKKLRETFHSIKVIKAASYSYS